MIVCSNALMLADLASLTGATGVLKTGVVRLFQNDFNPTRESPLADFTEATFQGYAPSAALVWGAPFIDSSAIPTVISDLKSFVMGSGGSGGGQQAFGYYVTDEPPTKVLLSERFASPVGLIAPGNQVNVVVQLQAVSQVG